LSAPFTEAELEFLKRRFDVQFGEAPAISDGIVLKTWKSGAEKGKAKLPAAMKSLVERKMMLVVSLEGRMPVARFTDIGLRALAHVLMDDQVFSAARFQHLRSQMKTPE